MTDVLDAGRVLGHNRCMHMRPETMRMLEHAGLADREACARSHPARVRLAVGRDETRIREVVSWLTDGDPARAYVAETVPRSLLNGLYPGLERLWERIRRRRDEDDAS